MIRLYGELLSADAAKIAGKTFNFGFENQKVIELARIIQTEIGSDKVKIEVKNVVDNRDYHISSKRILTELGYQPVSSIVKEVANLTQKLKEQFANIDDPKHYNMQTMKLSRMPGAYDFLSL